MPHASMVLLCSLILLMLIGIGLVLFVPVVITVDTTIARYELRWGVIRVRLSLDERGAGYRFNAPFFEKEGRFRQMMPGGGMAPARVAKREPSTASWRARPGRAIPAIVRSFRVRRFQLILDTGDVIWNARLFPVFHLLRIHGHDARISFIGHSTLRLTLENNIFRLLKAVISDPTNQHTKP